jgi:hypothetical protein
MRIPSVEWDEHRSTTKYWLAEPEDKENLEETIKRMAKMDHTACAEFYDRTSSVVHGLAQQMLNNPAIAEGYFGCLFASLETGGRIQRAPRDAHDLVDLAGALARAC